MNIYKERISCTNGRDVACNVLEVSIYYDIGGYNYFTSTPKKRGYYLSVNPLVVTDNLVSYEGFSGTNVLLNEVKRQSKKGEEEALKLLPQFKQKLIDYICNKHGITVKETA